VTATVTFSRGGLPESEHRVSWCVADAGGTVLEGEGDLEIFLRSAAKPLQALPAVRAGVAQRFGFGERELALASASHGGGPAHVAVAASMLAAAGLSEDDLGLGPLGPRDPSLHLHPTRLTHNCSGKHAFALAHCVVEGWDRTGYLSSGHPLQEGMRGAVAEAAGREPDDVPHGTDGCGMCTFHLPLRALATAFGRLAGGGLGEAGDRVAAAMRAHPELVAYDGAIDTELMRAHEGAVAKVGAEGVLAIGLADGRGLALKVHDGAMRAIDPAGVALAREALGLAADSAALEDLARPVVLNSVGETVGQGEARL
jgi:L-asparaginase II